MATVPKSSQVLVLLDLLIAVKICLASRCSVACGTLAERRYLRYPGGIKRCVPVPWKSVWLTRLA